MPPLGNRDARVDSVSERTLLAGMMGSGVPAALKAAQGPDPRDSWARDGERVASLLFRS